MKKITALVLLTAMIAAAGCATVRGMGEDLQSLGRGIKKTVDENDDKRR